MTIALGEDEAQSPCDVSGIDFALIGQFGENFGAVEAILLTVPKKEEFSLCGGFLFPESEHLEANFVEILLFALCVSRSSVLSVGDKVSSEVGVGFGRWRWSPRNRLLLLWGEGA